MTREEYDKLKASGMMWEIFPRFTGNYGEDMNTLALQMGDYPEGQKYAPKTKVWVLETKCNELELVGGFIGTVVKVYRSGAYNIDLDRYLIRRGKSSHTWWDARHLIPLYSLSKNELKELKMSNKEIDRYLKWLEDRDPWTIAYRKRLKKANREWIMKCLMEVVNEAKMDM